MEYDEHARAIAAALDVCTISPGGLPEPVPFADGSGRISAASQAGLQRVATALLEKPSLDLIISGTAELERDILVGRKVIHHATLACASSVRFRMCGARDS